MFTLCEVSTLQSALELTVGSGVICVKIDQKYRTTLLLQPKHTRNREHLFFFFIILFLKLKNPS